MTKRTDVHRPSVIDPAEYQYIACEFLKTEDIGDAHFLMVERDRIREHMERTGGTYSRHAHGGNCHICGASAIYTALFYHKPTNTYVRTGHECADKLDCGEVEHFRKNVYNARRQRAGKRKAAAVLADIGLSAAYDVYAAKSADERNEEATIRDIVGKLVAYGSLSEKQIGFLRKLVDRIQRRAEIDAQRAAEHAAAAELPAVEGRMTIRGEILGTKDPEFGPLRMIVRSPDGWKVFGTVPKSLPREAAALRGLIVEFDASVVASADDPKFGFFSRPTKARVLATI